MFKVWDSSNSICKEVNTIEEAYKVIRDYIESINFKSYYWRHNFLDDGSTWVDYGSHSHFFYVKEVGSKNEGK